jgi:hypothetical protein
MSIAVKGEPSLVSNCCCEACQRRTGSFFGVTVFFAESQVQGRSGEHRTYRRVAESGNAIDFQFCPTCGSTVWWTAQARPGTVLVSGGALADPTLPDPGRYIWTDHRHPSVCVPEGVPAFPRGPN